MPSPPQSSSSRSQNYPLGRGHHSAARLNLQHYLWKSTFGYLIHPTIPITQPGTKIADIGTGTGIWLLDLHESLPSEPDVQLDGLDIDLSQSPHSAWLPARLSFSRFDVYDETPPELIGKYDLINVRFFICVVRDGDPGSLISLFARMLKPGGWLQWTELDIQTLKVESAPGVEHVEHTQVLRDFALAPTPDWPVEYVAASFLQIMRSGWNPDDSVYGFLTSSLIASYRTQYWTSRLADIMAEHGFSNAVEDRRAKAPWQKPNFHDVTLLAMEEMGRKLPGGTALEKIHNAAREFDESNRGLTIVGDSVCTIARKS